MQTTRTRNRSAKAVQPITLAAQALQAEQSRHEGRMAMLKRMEARLRMLDAFMPAVRAAGINVHGDELNDWGRGTIYVGGALMNPQRNATLEKVLRAQGMREVGCRRHADGSYTVELKKGHLTLCISVEAHRLPKTQEAAA